LTANTPYVDVNGAKKIRRAVRPKTTAPEPAEVF